MRTTILGPVFSGWFFATFVFSLFGLLCLGVTVSSMVLLSSFAVGCSVAVGSGSVSESITDPSVASGLMFSWGC